MLLKLLLVAATLALFLACIEAKQGKDAPLNNNPTFRDWSNRLDQKLGTSYDNPRDSKLRATIHAGYHALQGARTGNQREFERAKDQWATGWGGKTNNLE